MENLFQSAAAIHSRHPTTKTLDIYQKYDDFISHHLLLGTFKNQFEESFDIRSSLKT
jgi:hypothetical protein